MAARDGLQLGTDERNFIATSAFVRSRIMGLLRLLTGIVLVCASLDRLTDARTLFGRPVAISTASFREKTA
jgi:hypothetical protein